MTENHAPKHASPNLGVVALVYMALFIGGLVPVTSLGGTPYFPGPWESADTIAAFFRARPAAVVACACLQFGATIPLGVFTATASSRLRFLGVRAAGATIALFGGFATCMNIAAGSFLLWVMARPDVASETGLLNALYHLQFAFGGVGFSVPMGLLLAGLAASAGLSKLLPRWMMAIGFVLALAGLSSWLDMITPKALPLIPLTRFPGFLWLIAAGFLLPKRARRAAEALAPVSAGVVRTV